MYRALAFKALRAGTPLDDAESLLHLTRTTRINLQPNKEGNRVLLDGVDVTSEIRAADVTAAASRVSVHGAVREWMVAAQRAMVRDSEYGIVMEGRDIGTVVFPHAEVKLFLDASLEARGDRRFIQQEGAGRTKEAVLQEMGDRDNRDRSREQSPLAVASDAILIDTTTLSLVQVLSETERIVSQCLATAHPSDGRN